MVSISVVIPQYNELKNLQRGVLDQVYEYFKTSNIDFELIISDDESSDKSLEFAKEFAKGKSEVTILTNTHGGKAYAIAKGVESATKEFILMTDMDQSTPISEISKLINFVEGNFEVVIGSRGKDRSSHSFFRKIASSTFVLFRKILLLRDINDTQCGFKLLKTDLAKEIFPLLDAVINHDVNGWKVSAFDVEMLFVARKKGCKIKEVDVLWNNEDISETKNRKFVKESIDMLRQIILVKIKNIKGDY